MENKPVVMVCPLDWGLGHATRCIPLIEHYHAQGCKVVIVGHGRSLALLRTEFPGHDHVVLKGFSVRYSSTKRFLLFSLASQLPIFMWHKWAEHRKLKKLIGIYKPSLIVSDNRYGLYRKKTKSVIISHQLSPHLPKPFHIFAPVVGKILAIWIGKFDQCWIPDNQGADNLSGKLANPTQMPPNTFFIGHLSRFCKKEINLPNAYNLKGQQLNRTSPQAPKNLIAFPQKKPFILAIASGPEPQRTIFASLLIQQMQQMQICAILALGIPNDNNTPEQIGNLTVVPYLSAFQLEILLKQTSWVICRSGYSSVMDLACMGKKAILIPTPGQTEQEYLATYLMQQKRFFSVPQQELNLEVHLSEAEAFYDSLSNFGCAIKP